MDTKSKKEENVLDSNLGNEENVSEDIITEENPETNVNPEESTDEVKSAPASADSKGNNDINKKKFSPSNEKTDPKPEKRKESLESIIRRFKKQSSGIVAEVRRREAYDKPSVKRKKKSKEARKKKAGRLGSNRWR